MRIPSLLTASSPVFVGCLLGLLFLGIACDDGPPPSDPAQEGKETTVRSDSSLKSSEVPDSTTRRQTSRGLDPTTARMSTFSLKDYMPKLYGLVEADAAMTSELETYAQKIIIREALESEDDLIQLFEERETGIIPHLIPFFENMDNEQFYQEMNVFEAELNQIGLTFQTAEGMFIGLGAASVLESDIERLASEPYRLYLAFQNANAEASQGEYPFADMKPFQEMIVLGEQINALAPNPYIDKIKMDYEMALLSFTDVHLVRDASAREEEGGTPMVGGVHTEHYPFLTETETLTTFSETKSQSAYGEVMRKLAENMSEISNKPENVYVIVTEWADDIEMAQSRVVSHLADGKDIPHYLRIRRGDGTDKYAVAYRFYEDDTKAEAALEKILPTFPNAKLVFCSVRNQELYQLGPSAD
ncbi:MAG: hypothetical protein AAF587_32015 [Bacteroidota bacterium]